MRLIISIYLIVMCIQYIPWEGWEVSPIKMVFLCISPSVLIHKNLTKMNCSMMFAWLSYLALLLIFAFFSKTEVRWLSIGYSVGFIVMYIMFYSYVEQDVFSKDYFNDLTKKLLSAFIIVLILQQIVSLAGIAELPLINLCGSRQYLLKCQSLTQEPSSSARVMGALFYAFIKTVSGHKSKNELLSLLWYEHKWLLIGYIYAMISMLSATAILVLFLTFSIFFTKKNLWRYLCLIIIVFSLLKMSENTEILRLEKIGLAFLAGDRDAINNADGSASYRIMQIVNIFYMDYSDPRTWFGHGIDSMREKMFTDISNTMQLVDWRLYDYGLLFYLFGFVLVFTYCIKPFFSLMTVLYLLGLGGSIGNVAYGWGIIMIFTVVSYFNTVKAKDSFKTERAMVE